MFVRCVPSASSTTCINHAITYFLESAADLQNCYTKICALDKLFYEYLSHYSILLVLWVISTVMLIWIDIQLAQNMVL